VESPVFVWACSVLEESTPLNRLQARGTIRLVLHAAGLVPEQLNARQLKVLAERLLPRELAARGIAGADAICSRLADCPEAIQQQAVPEAPVDVFERLGRKPK
jgi:hypothetical protein